MVYALIHFQLVALLTHNGIWDIRMWMWMRIARLCVFVCPLLLKSFQCMLCMPFHQNEFPSNTISCSFHTQFYCHLVNLLCLCGSYANTHTHDICIFYVEFWLYSSEPISMPALGKRRRILYSVRTRISIKQKTLFSSHISVHFICFAYFDWLSRMFVFVVTSILVVVVATVQRVIVVVTVCLKLITTRILSFKIRWRKNYTTIKQKQHQFTVPTHTCTIIYEQKISLDRMKQLTATRIN